MNGGVEILLARMETHPEEFFRDSRWRPLLADFAKDLDQEDFRAIEQGLRKCRQQEFTGIVMQRLIGEEKEEKDLLRRTYSNPMMLNSFEDMVDKDEDMAEDGFSPAQRMAIKKAKGEI